MDSERCTEDDDVLQHSILFTPKSTIPLFPQARPQKIWATLFSMPDNQSILKIVWVYRFCSLSQLFYGQTLEIKRNISCGQKYNNSLAANLLTSPTVQKF